MDDRVEQVENAEKADSATSGEGMSRRKSVMGLAAAAATLAAAGLVGEASADSKGKGNAAKGKTPAGSNAEVNAEDTTGDPTAEKHRKSGKRGPTGPTGPKGNTGATGPGGPAGGPTGPAGKDGANGADGATGATGPMPQVATPVNSVQFNNAGALGGSNGFVYVTEDGANNVGIGTATPGSRLHVRNNNNQQNIAILQAATGQLEPMVLIEDNGGNELARLTFGHPQSGLNNGSLWFGKQSGQANTGVNNTALGTGTIATNGTGRENVAVGYNAGTLIQDGNRNTLVGSQAGSAVEDGTCNTLIGRQAGSNVSDGDDNIAIGCGAQVVDGTVNGQLAIAKAIFGEAITSFATARIGIGTTGPTARLHVDGPTGPSTANYLTFRVSSTPAGPTGPTVFGIAGSGQILTNQAMGVTAFGGANFTGTAILPIYDPNGNLIGYVPVGPGPQGFLS